MIRLVFEKQWLHLLGLAVLLPAAAWFTRQPGVATGEALGRDAGEWLWISIRLAVAHQVLGVLSHMHGQGVVHRDIKPSNLLVDGDGSIRLADLGLARPVEDSRALTRTQTVPGTPRYMSPEQIRGHKPSPAADLYSLGVTLYQLLTGAPPFTGSSDFDVADQHLRSPGMKQFDQL